MVIPKECAEHGDKADVTFECVCCGKDKTLKNVRLKGVFDYYRRGALIQAAFPEMPAADRELFVSGTCGKCFKKMLG